MEDKLIQNKSIKKVNKKGLKTVKVFVCKNCGKDNVTLIKATDSYYCKFCFDKLKKKKFEKKGKHK